MKSKDLSKLVDGLIEAIPIFFFFFTSSDYIHEDNEFYVKSTNISEEEFLKRGHRGLKRSQSQ